MRILTGVAAIALLALLATTSLAATRPDTLLIIKGDVEKPYVLSKAEYAALPRQMIRAEGHDAKLSDFEGVWLMDLLSRAGMKLGKDMRGDRVAIAVIAQGADGYHAVFSAAEVDSAFTSVRVLVSDTRDGKPTIATDGPLRLVVPGDKKFGRWVRQVVSITVKQL